MTPPGRARRLVPQASWWPVGPSTLNTQEFISLLQSVGVSYLSAGDALGLGQAGVSVALHSAPLPSSWAERRLALLSAFGMYKQLDPSVAWKLRSGFSVLRKSIR